MGAVQAARDGEAESDDGLHGKEGGDAQVIALGKELKARYKYGKKTLDLFKKAMKAGEAKKVEALKEIQGARESGDEAYNELKAAAVERGADATVRDKAGKVASDYAELAPVRAALSVTNSPPAGGRRREEAACSRRLKRGGRGAPAG